MGKRFVGPVCEEVVRPSGSGRETGLVLLSALLTILVCGSVVALRNSATEAGPAPSWQVDAFGELGAGELAVFNALSTAAPEIEMIHEETGDWPTVARLEADYLPPFVEDAAWERNGAFAWGRVAIASAEKHIMLYVGRPRGDGAAFMLVMLHDHVKKEGNAGGSVHAPFEIWMHPSSAAEVPETLTDQMLIGQGWREVLARRGEEEIRRGREGFIQ